MDILWIWTFMDIDFYGYGHFMDMDILWIFK